VAYFYAARAPRSRGALWPSFAPALIAFQLKEWRCFQSVANLSLSDIPVNREIYRETLSL
jgi:hypothetical protein